MKTATEWLSSAHVTEWCDKQRKFKEMSAEEYAEQLTDLIDYAGTELSDADSHRVLSNAFRLLWTRLGVKIEAKAIIPREVL